MTITHPDKYKIDALANEDCEEKFYAWDLDSMRESDTELWFGFNTDYVPPISVYKELIEQGFDVVAYYDEETEGFCGKFDNGNDHLFAYAILKTDKDPIAKEVDEYFEISARLEGVL